MSEDKIIMASADGHVGPPTLVYRDYMESWLHPQFDEYYATHVWRWSPESEDSFFPQAIQREVLEHRGFGARSRHRGGVGSQCG